MSAAAHEAQTELLHRLLPFGSDSGATFSPDRRYRYRLWRSWGDRENRVVFVGVNPSSADEADNDHTITKEIGFAQRWGFGALDKVNLFVRGGVEGAAGLSATSDLEEVRFVGLEDIRRLGGVVVPGDISEVCRTPLASCGFYPSDKRDLVRPKFVTGRFA